MALDELLDGDGRAAVDPQVDERALELAHRCRRGASRRAGAVARLDDQRVADLGGERPHLLRTPDSARLGARDAGAPQRLLHRRLVAAEERRLDARARDAGSLAHLGGRHDVRLDRRLEAIDLGVALHPLTGSDLAGS